MQVAGGSPRRGRRYGTRTPGTGVLRSGTVRRKSGTRCFVYLPAPSTVAQPQEYGVAEAPRSDARRRRVNTVTLNGALLNEADGASVGPAVLDAAYSLARPLGVAVGQGPLVGDALPAEEIAPVLAAGHNRPASRARVDAPHQNEKRITQAGRGRRTKAPGRTTVRSGAQSYSLRARLVPILPYPPDRCLRLAFALSRKADSSAVSGCGNGRCASGSAA